MILLITLGLYLQFTTGQSYQVNRVSWQRMGGFIGLMENFSISSNGSALYTSNRFGDFDAVLSQDKIITLIKILEDANFFNF